MDSTFIIYGSRTSTATSRVRLTLAEAGITTYEFVQMDLSINQNKQPDHLARHPWGKIPALVTNDGFTVFESRAISKYLGSKYCPSLLPQPSALREMALFDEAQSVEMCYFSDLVTPISFEHFVKPLVLGGGAPERTIVEAARAKLEVFFDVCDARTLAERDYMASGRFTLVDIFYIPCVERLIACGYGSLIADRPNVAAWWDRCAARPAVKQFLEEEPLQAIREKLRGIAA